MKRVCKSAILFSVLSALSLSVYSQSRADQKESYSFQDKSDTANYRFDVAESMKRARLEVRASSISGVIEWKLRDPEGNVRLSGQVEDGNARGDTGPFQPVAGVWTLEIVMSNATGNYRYSWTAR